MKTRTKAKIVFLIVGWWLLPLMFLARTAMGLIGDGIDLLEKSLE